MAEVEDVSGRAAEGVQHLARLLAHRLGRREKRAGIEIALQRDARPDLVGVGVDKSRLELIGYGEKIPAARNENPDGTDSVKGRQLNRRVEFKVSIKKEDMIIVEPVKVPDELKIK